MPHLSSVHYLLGDQGPLLPTPPNNLSGDSKADVVLPNSVEKTKSSDSINPLLSGLLNSAGMKISNGDLSNGTVEDGGAQSKENFDSLLNDSANLQRLLGVLSPSQNASVQSGLNNPNLGGTPAALQNGLSSLSHFSQMPPPAVIGGLVPSPMAVPNLTVPPIDIFGMPAATASPILSSPLFQTTPPPQTPNGATMSMLLNAANTSKQPQAAMAPGHPDYMFQPQALAPTLDPSGFLLPAMPPPPTPLYPVPHSAASLTAAMAASQRMVTPNLYTMNKSQAYGHQTSSAASYPTTQLVSYTSIPPNSLASGISNLANMPGPATTSVYNTPTKRKNMNGRMLPSPEPSPEGGYVGQHSQGIGGHYQSSYMRKKSRRN